MPEKSLAELIRNAKPSSFTPIPEGTYPVKVDSAEFRFSSNGNAMFQVTFAVEEGDEHAGRKLWHNITISDKSVDIAVGTLGILGVTQDQLAAAIDDDPADVCLQLVDARARVKVIVKEWNGAPRNEVKRVLPAANSTPGAPPVGGSPATSTPARPDRIF